jgi:hypothetical protein
VLLLNFRRTTSYCAATVHPCLQTATLLGLRTEKCCAFPAGATAMASIAACERSFKDSNVVAAPHKYTNCTHAATDGAATKTTA